MTEEQKNHIETIIAYFIAKSSDKYSRGQIEHGGNLWEKKGIIDMAIEEAIDQVIYLVTLKQQLEDSGISLGTKEDKWPTAPCSAIYYPEELEKRY